jgi:hypothetical protein
MEALLTERAAAALLCLSVRTLQRLRQTAAKEAELAAKVVSASAATLQLLFAAAGEHGPARGKRRRNTDLRGEGIGGARCTGKTLYLIYSTTPILDFICSR